MEFVSVLGEQRVDVEEDGEVIAEIRLSEEYHPPRLMVELPGKQTRIIRL